MWWRRSTAVVMVLFAFALAPVALAAGSLSSGATVDAPARRVTPPSERRFTIAASGDVLLHSPLWHQAQRDAGGNGYDYRPMFAEIAPFIRGADLAICHLETPIAPVGEGFTTFPYFGVQPEIVDAIGHAGYDRCSTASNHAYDRGGPGMDRTIAVLAAAGIEQSGMARTPGDMTPKVFEVNGVRVTHLSYTWSYNGVFIRPEDRWRTFLIDPDRIVAEARRARELGAEVVVVSMHWGTERVHAVDPYQRRIAEAITAPGVIDLVIGHHAHVVQPIERVNGTWVMFGTGNHVADMSPATSWPAAAQDGGLFYSAISVDSAGRVVVERPTVVPTFVDRSDGFVIRPVSASIGSGRFGPSTIAELQRSLARTGAVLGPYVI